MKFDGKKPIEFTDETIKLEEEALEETKYKLKVDAPSTDTSFDSTEEPMGELPEDDLLSDLDDAPEEGGDDKPFDDEPFDAGVEADEDTDPEKFIQQLSGKLGQSLRQYTDDQGEPDFDLEKFAINSVISATHTSEMDRQDQKDIINKIKGSGKEEESGDADINDDLTLDDGPMDELVTSESQSNYSSPRLGVTLTQFMDSLIDKQLTDVKFVKVDKDKFGKDIMIFSTTTPMGNKNLRGIWWDNPDVKVLESGNDTRWIVYTVEDGVFEEGLIREKHEDNDKDKIDYINGALNNLSSEDLNKIYLSVEEFDPTYGVNEGDSNWGNDKNFEGDPNFGKDKQWESKLQESEKSSTFVNKDKLIKDLRLMENEEPMVEPQPTVKPETKPVRPMRETDRPFLPKRREQVKPSPKAGGDLINDSE